MRKRSGFTLTELVVVAVVGWALVLLILPALGAVSREHAKRIVCQSNLYALGAAYHQHAADHEGNFAIHRAEVPYLYFDYYNHPAASMSLYTNGYLDDRKILYCPKWASRSFGGKGWLASYSNRPYRHAGGWYGYQGGWYEDGALKPLRLGDVENPHLLGLLCDLLYSSHHMLHGYAWNVLFVDGHTQFISVDDTFWGIWIPLPGVDYTRSHWLTLETYANGATGGY